MSSPIGYLLLFFVAVVAAMRRSRYVFVLSLIVYKRKQWAMTNESYQYKNHQNKQINTIIQWISIADNDRKQTVRVSLYSDSA